MIAGPCVQRPLSLEQWHQRGGQDAAPAQGASLQAGIAALWPPPVMRVSCSRPSVSKCVDKDVFFISVEFWETR